MERSRTGSRIPGSTGLQPACSRRAPHWARRSLVADPNSPKGLRIPATHSAPVSKLRNAPTISPPPTEQGEDEASSLSAPVWPCEGGQRAWVAAWIEIAESPRWQASWPAELRVQQLVPCATSARVCPWVKTYRERNETYLAAAGRAPLAESTTSASIAERRGEPTKCWGR
jgi:hypothetical protein